MTREMGYQVPTTLSSWTALASASTENNADLAWPASVEVFDRMRKEDSQVSSVLRAVTLPIRSAKWSLDVEGVRDEVATLVAGDLGIAIRGRGPVSTVRSRGRFSWQEHLRLALLELVYGHAFFEQVYDVRRGDGLAHLAKLAWRPPRTISAMNVASDGGLLSIEQWAADGAAVRIPVSRLVAYVNDREGGEWYGQSLLRSAYKNWLLKDRLLRSQALTVERNGLGVPVYTGAKAPEKATVAESKEWMDSQREEGLKVAQSFRAGQTAGASIPASSSLDLKGVSGTLPDTDAPIRYHDEQIARSVLAHFLNLGTETGSWALGSTFADFFTQSLNAGAQQIRDVVQQHVIEDLVDLNWGKDEPAPRLRFEPIGKEHPATAEAVKALTDAGALTIDDDVEAYVRDLYGLPIADPTTARTHDHTSEGGADEPTEENA